MYKKFVIIILLLVIVLMWMRPNKIEGYNFKDTGKKNKSRCRDFHYRIYNNCVRNSGGIDIQGNCYDRLIPNIVACDKNDY